MFRVIRRNPDTWREVDDRQEYEIIEIGNESVYLRDALVEMEARNRLLGEGEPRWDIEHDNWISLDPGDNWTTLDPDDYLREINCYEVYEYLVAKLGVPEAKAEKLVS